MSFPFSSMPIPPPIRLSLPIGGVTQVDLPNDHLQYAFTWYGLAAVLIVVVAISWFRKGAKTPQQ